MGMYEDMDRMMKDLNDNSFVRFMGNVCVGILVLAMFDKITNSNPRPDPKDPAAIRQVVEGIRDGANEFLELTPEQQQQRIEMEKQRQAEMDEAAREHAKKFFDPFGIFRLIEKGKTKKADLSGKIKTKSEEKTPSPGRSSVISNADLICDR